MLLLLLFGVGGCLLSCLPFQEIHVASLLSGDSGDVVWWMLCYPSGLPPTLASHPAQPSYLPTVSYATFVTT